MRSTFFPLSPNFLTYFFIFYLLPFAWGQEENIPDSDILTVSSTVYVDKQGNIVQKPDGVDNVDTGLDTLKKAAIGVSVVIGLALIGIFILRKWKFSPTNRFRQKLASSEGFRQRSAESDHVFLRELHAP